MTIETTTFANASIAVSPTGASSGNFGILGFLTKHSDYPTHDLLSAERGRAYASLPSVLADWPAATEVAKAASAFYAQTPTPTDFVALMNYDVAQAAALVGGPRATYDDLILHTTGTLSLTVDGTPVSLTGIDLSSAADLDAIALILDTAVSAVVTGATVVNGTYGFVLVGNTTGASGSVTFATGTLADDLGFSQHLGKLSQGIDVETPIDSLSDVVVKGIEFVGLDVHKDMRDEIGQATGLSTIDIGNWAEANKKIYMHTSNSLAVLNASLTTDTISLHKANTLRYTLSVFSKNLAQYPGSSVFGRAASVNFAAIDSTITLNLKQMPTITAEDLTDGEYKALTGKFGSAVVQIGKDVNAFANSRMASGSWLDTTHGLLWLENRIEVDMFNFLYQSATKPQFTQPGLNSAEEVLERSLESAVRNGLCAPGFLADGTYLAKGWVINSVKLAQVPSSDKGARQYKGLSFKMVGAGALHEVEVTGEFTE